MNNRHRFHETSQKHLNKISKSAVITLDKTEYAYTIWSYLTFTLNHHFWDDYKGIHYKGKFYSITDRWETADLIEKLIKEN